MSITPDEKINAAAAFIATATLNASTNFFTRCTLLDSCTGVGYNTTTTLPGNSHVKSNQFPIFNPSISRITWFANPRYLFNISWLALPIMISLSDTFYLCCFIQ